MGKDNVDVIDEMLKLLDVEEELRDRGVNPYVHDPMARAWLNECLPGTRVAFAGGSAPFQAEGFIRDYPFYYRERHGEAVLKIALPGDDPIIGFNWASLTTVEDCRDADDVWVLTFLRLVEEMDSALFRYKYNARIEFPGEPTKDVFVYAWGKSPESAIADYIADHRGDKYSEYLVIDQTAINTEFKSSPFQVNVPDYIRGEDGKIAHE